MWLKTVFKNVSSFVAVKEKDENSAGNVSLRILECIDALWNSPSRSKDSQKSLPIKFKIVSVEWLIRNVNEICSSILAPSSEGRRYMNVWGSLLIPSAFGGWCGMGIMGRGGSADGLVLMIE